jgi:hypothetical protein
MIPLSSAEILTFDYLRRRARRTVIAPPSRASPLTASAESNSGARTEQAEQVFVWAPAKLLNPRTRANPNAIYPRKFFMLNNPSFDFKLTIYSDEDERLVEQLRGGVRPELLPGTGSWIDSLR